MRVSPKLVGKVVAVVWRDPVGGERVKLAKIARGLDALATWTEYGVVGDVTDGIVRIDHSLGENPPGDADREHEVMPTWVPEVLIEKLTVLVPEAPQAPDGVAT